MFKTLTLNSVILLALHSLVSSHLLCSAPGVLLFRLTNFTFVLVSFFHHTFLLFWALSQIFVGGLVDGSCQRQHYRSGNTEKSLFHNSNQIQGLIVLSDIFPVHSHSLTPPQSMTSERELPFVSGYFPAHYPSLENVLTHGVMVNRSAARSLCGSPV